MYITEINIVNFKTFEERFTLKLNEGLNILVGDNEAGKSTILEAINLVLSGTIGGKFIKNELNQYLFNNAAVKKYVDEANEEGGKPQLPEIYIEIHLSAGDGKFKGDDNLDGVDSCGLYMKIAFDDKYNGEYAELIKNKDVKTLPIEYYDVYWGSFARDNAITSRSIPIKAALIDSSSSRFQNGSDIYISRIVRDLLDTKDIVAISQAHRKMKDAFGDDGSVSIINDKLKKAANISNKDVTLGVDLSSRSAWEGSLLTYLDKVPFHHVGKGEQSTVKTKLALGHKKSQEANIILLEEPENHLSHTKLNSLIKDITDHKHDKQVIVSTHNSFVANKLGLGSLILLNDHKTVRLDDLSADTQRFFTKLSGYDTLRLILCKKAILVEGDSDELIVQKAYMINHDGRLPIEDGIDVISVGVSFLRFLEIAEKIKKNVAVVTDNDGDVDALKRKYIDYLEPNKKNNIDVYFDTTVDPDGSLEKFNYNTLEPKMLKANNRDLLNKVFGKTYATDDELLKYMHDNKTECALAIFETTEQVKYPQYILDSIE
jgi:putative ATP-dependent endonuclease of OLD family